MPWYILVSPFGINKLRDLWLLRCLTLVGHTQRHHLGQHGEGEQWWAVPHMALRDLGSLSLMGSMDFKLLSLLCQGRAVAMRLQIFQWLGKKTQIRDAEEHKKGKNFIE